MKTFALPIASFIVLGSSVALAQDAAPTPAPAHAASELSDHEARVHHFAVGYMGASQIPIAQVNNGGPGLNITEGNVTAPYIGARYWLSPLLGIDLGLGFAYASATETTTQTGQPTVSADRPSVFGFGLHAGVPLALAYSKHFTFEVIPELNFGYASSSRRPPSPTQADRRLMRLGFASAIMIACTEGPRSLADGGIVKTDPAPISGDRVDASNNLPPSSVDPLKSKCYACGHWHCGEIALFLVFRQRNLQLPELRPPRSEPPEFVNVCADSEVDVRLGEKVIVKPKAGKPRVCPKSDSSTCWDCTSGR